MSEYQLTATDVVFKYEGEWWIPNDPANTMRMEYDKWLANGGVPDPAPIVLPPPPPPPDANLRIDAGVLASLTTAVAAVAAIHAIPTNFNANNFAALLTQMKIVGDSFVAMLEAHAATSDIDVDKPDGKPPEIDKPQ